MCTIFDELNDVAPDEYPSLPTLLFQIKTVIPYVLEDATKWHDHCSKEDDFSQQSSTSSVKPCPSIYENMLQGLEQDCRLYIRTQ